MCSHYKSFLYYSFLSFFFRFSSHPPSFSFFLSHLLRLSLCLPESLCALKWCYQNILFSLSLVRIASPKIHNFGTFDTNILRGTIRLTESQRHLVFIKPHYFVCWSPKQVPKIFIWSIICFNLFFLYYIQFFVLMSTSC